MSAEEIVERLRDFFDERGGEYAAVYLFGSVARGSAGPRSDVDIAVLPKQWKRGALAGMELDLEGDLERLLGRTVQVVPLQTAPPDLVHRVLRDGILVLEGDRARRVAFEVRLRNEYFDVLPYVEEYRKPRAS